MLTRECQALQAAASRLLGGGTGAGGLLSGLEERGIGLRQLEDAAAARAGHEGDVRDAAGGGGLGGEVASGVAVALPAEQRTGVDDQA